MKTFERQTPNESYQTLLLQATKLPELSLTLGNNYTALEPLEALHRRFDLFIVKLEAFEGRVAALTHRPPRLVPFTGAVSGMLKHCQQLKAQRDKQTNINYLCYLQAYQYVYGQVKALADLAASLLNEETIAPPTLTNIG